MASIRKRTLPSGKIVWLAAYADSGGGRRFKQFERKRDADAFLTRVKSEVASGTHVPDRQASTVDAAYILLIAALQSDQAARSTLHNYRVYYENHVKPYLVLDCSRSFTPRMLASGSNGSRPRDAPMIRAAARAWCSASSSTRRSADVSPSLIRCDHCEIGGRCAAWKSGKPKRRYAFPSAR